MDFTCIRIRELEQFANSNFNLNGYIVAITPWRAASQVKNPFARPDDVALVYAKDEKGQICGYIGAIPAELQGRPGVRYFWNSCWWTREGTPAGISIGLLNELLRIWDYNILLSEMTERTAGIIDRFCPSEFKSRIGFHIWLRSDISNKIILSRKTQSIYKVLKFLAFSGIFYVLDLIINSVLYTSQLLTAMKLNDSDFYCSESEAIDEEDEVFIKKHIGNDVFYPDKDWFNWILNNPWLVKKSDTNRDVASRYYFTSFTRENKFSILKIKKEGKITGLFFLSSRDKTVRTQFVYIDKNNGNSTLKCFIAFLLRKYEYKDLISYNPVVTEYLTDSMIPFLRKRKISRYYAVSDSLLPYTGKSFTMQDGSGDYAFT